MKTCKECRLQYDDNKKFCKKCGSALIDDKKIETKESAKKLVFEERLKADPLNLKILREFALFLSDKSMFSDTISISLKILAIDENDLIAKKLLTYAYYRLNMYEQAIESAEQLLTENSDDIELLKIIIRAFHASEKHDNAILYCNKLLALEPINSEILHTKALSLLSSGKMAEASHIFAKLKKEGFKDRQTLIYAGISCSLNNEFEVAIEILKPVLSDKELSYIDIDNNRGFLYMAYCLSQFEYTASKVDEWFSFIDFQLLKENYHVLDEQTYIKLAKSVFERTFASEQLVFSRYDIEKLIHKYLKSRSEYLTVQTKELQAELWYKISLKQAEMKLFDEAKQSLNESIDLMPFKTEYSEKRKEVGQVHVNIKRRKKRKSIIIWSVVIALLMIVVAAVYIDKRQKENEAWEESKRLNTYGSYGNYVIKFPDGRFSQEAAFLQEEVLWQRTKEINTIKSYGDYLENYPNGKYKSEAASLKEDLAWQKASENNNIASYDDYLGKYPNGKYKSEAAGFKEHLVWEQTSKINTLESYSNYLSIYSSGKFSAIAKNRFEALKPKIKILGRGTHIIRLLSGEVSQIYQIQASLNNYSFSSPNYNYEIWFTDGEKVKAGKYVTLKWRSIPEFRLFSKEGDTVTIIVQ